MSAPASSEAQVAAASPAPAQPADAQPTATAAAAGEEACSTVGCANAARQSCPTCIQLGLKPARFCSQECFKAAWKDHNNNVHKPERERQSFRPPMFDYTGPLRPAYVSPRRSVPEHIPKPDYAASGMPGGENAITIHINSEKEIRAIRNACRIGREALDLAARHVRPGITTDELDRIVHEYIISQDAYPSPLNYKWFPKSCCTSVNEVICHGIPDARALQDGDIVNVDVTVYKDGAHGDLNETFCVGPSVDQKSKDLIKTTHDCLMKALELVRPGCMFRDFGDVITKAAGKAGFSVVRTYCGHGIGKAFHTAPSIPHYARNKAVGSCKSGMVFTVEPMINVGTWKDVTWPDDWTSVTADGKRSAQFEHTVLVTDKGCEILTARTKNSPPMWWEAEAATAVDAAATSSN